MTRAYKPPNLPVPSQTDTSNLTSATDDTSSHRPIVGSHGAAPKQTHTDDASSHTAAMQQPHRDDDNSHKLVLVASSNHTALFT